MKGEPLEPNDRHKPLGPPIRQPAPASASAPAPLQPTLREHVWINERGQRETRDYPKDRQGAKPMPPVRGK